MAVVAGIAVAAGMAVVAGIAVVADIAVVASMAVVAGEWFGGVTIKLPLSMTSAPTPPLLAPQPPAHPMAVLETPCM